MSTHLGGGSLPTAHSLVAMTEAKDPYLRGHAQRVCGLAVAIATYLGIRDRSLETIRVAALLHDVGKLELPEDVLHKPGALTDEEFAVMQEHSERGYEIVASAPALAGAAAGVRSHHERLDGSGYPDGLEGDEIPIEARIVAVADVWDALTSRRVYRDALSHNDARRIIQHEAGSRLDLSCVRALFAILDRMAADNFAPRSPGLSLAG
jgi:HD-GYP domain-containing protein (c-di-GMP phosphodiesterase class II)